MPRRIGHPAAFITLTLLLVVPPCVIGTNTHTKGRGIVSAIPGALLGGRTRYSYSYDRVLVIETDDGSLAAYDVHDLHNARIDWGEAIFGDETIVPCAELFSFPRFASFGLLTTWARWSHRYYRLTINPDAACAADQAAIEDVLRQTSLTTASEDYPDLTTVTFNAPNDRRTSIDRAGLGIDLAYIAVFAIWCASLTQLPYYSKRARRERRNRCPACNYPREGLSSTNCPECGEPLPSTHDPSDRRVG